MERGINYENLVNIALPTPQLDSRVHMSNNGRHGEVRVGRATFSAKNIITDHALFLGNTFSNETTFLHWTFSKSKKFSQDDLFSNVVLNFSYKITFSDKITFSSSSIISDRNIWRSPAAQIHF